MKVSIITATFNSETTVLDTLHSVRKQAGVEVEHIVIDGASRDSTVSLVRQFSNEIKLISEQDAGIYDAMNKGIGIATGDVIGILNSDDFYAGGDVLQQVVSAFRNSSCDAVYGDLQYVSKEDPSRVTRSWRAGPYRQGAFKWGWMPPHPTFFVRRHVYENFGKFNLDMKTAADYEIMLRFIHKHGIKLAYIPSVLVKMRTGGASNASLNNRIRANREDRRAWACNGLQPFWFTLYLKPVRKISQFILK